jgi:hypothetical protein
MKDYCLLTLIDLKEERDSTIHCGNFIRCTMPYQSINLIFVFSTSTVRNIEAKTFAPYCIRRFQSFKQKLFSSDLDQQEKVL